MAARLSIASHLKANCGLSERIVEEETSADRVNIEGLPFTLVTGIDDNDEPKAFTVDIAGM